MSVKSQTSGARVRSQVGLPPLNPYFLPLLRRSKVGASVQASSPPSCNASETGVSLSDDISPRSSGSAFVGSLCPAQPIREEDLSALHTLFNPSPEFAGKIKVPTLHISLGWLFRKPPEPPEGELLTLDNFPTDLFTSSSENSGKAIRRRRRRVLLNSPRSVITVLRNGVSLEDLQEHPRHDVEVEGALAGRAPHVIQMRYEHREARRQQLLAGLREQYHSISAQLSLGDVMEFFGNFDRLTPALNPKLPGSPGAGESSDEGSPVSVGHNDSRRSPLSFQPGSPKSSPPVETNATEECSVTAEPPAAQLPLDHSDEPTQDLLSPECEGLPAITARPATPVPPVALPTQGVASKNLHVSAAESPHSSKPTTRSLTSLSPSLTLPSSRSTASKLSRALQSLVTVDRSCAEWGSRLVSESTTRMEKLLSRTVEASERSSEMHRLGIERSLAKQREVESRLRAQQEA
eukprot:RCo011866